MRKLVDGTYCWKHGSSVKAAPALSTTETDTGATKSTLVNAPAPNHNSAHTKPSIQIAVHRAAGNSGSGSGESVVFITDIPLQPGDNLVFAYRT